MSSASTPPTHERVLRLASHMLRHAPEMYGLKHDDYGWCCATRVIASLNARRRQLQLWRPWTLNSLSEWVNEHSDRFEMNSGAVRARYGHSIPVRSGIVDVPPARLFHGTAIGYLQPILNVGLKPAQRTYVHLTTDPEYALAVADAFRGWGALVAVDAKAASESGIIFRRASTHVWLVEHIPSQFIHKV